MIIKSAVAAFILFALFIGALLFARPRKKTGKNGCHEEGEHGCRICGCHKS